MLLSVQPRLSRNPEANRPRDADTGEPAVYRILLLGAPYDNPACHLVIYQWPDESSLRGPTLPGGSSHAARVSVTKAAHRALLNNSAPTRQNSITGGSTKADLQEAMHASAALQQLQHISGMSHSRTRRS